MSTVAQKYYEKQMGWVEGQDIRKIIVQSDTIFMVFGNYNTIALNNQWWAYAMQINLQGDSICGRHYEDEEAEQLTIWDATKINGGYALPLNVYVDAYHTHTGLQIVDSCGDYFFRSDYVSPLGHTVYYTITRTFDNGYLIGGNIYPPTVLDFKPYLLKLDAYGTVLWERAYTNVPKDGVVADILPAADSSGYFVLSSYNYDELSYTLKTRITKINEDGDSILLDKIYNFETDYYATGKFAYTTDGNIIMYGTRHPYNYTGFVAKIDANTLDTIWVHRNNTGGSGGAEILSLADGNYIIGDADRNYINPSGLGHNQAVIYKLSADGEILWYRHYGGEGNDYCYDITASPDGGYMMAGRTDTLISNGTGGFYSNADIYIVKTNCMGLLTLPQANFTYSYDTSTLVANFYNLSQYTYPDSIDGGYYIWDFGDGDTLLQHSDAPSSANFVHQYHNNEPHTVTLTAIVCNDTSRHSLNLHHSLDVVGVEAVSSQSYVKVYPNPSNGNFYIDYSISNDEQATLSVYNINGHPVYTNSFGGGRGKATINTNNWQTGLYYYTLQQANGSILQRDKIVVIQ